MTFGTTGVKPKNSALANHLDSDVVGPMRIRSNETSGAAFVGTKSGKKASEQVNTFRRKNTT